MNEIKNNCYNFLSLPEELNPEILSNLDRNTQYKVSWTCKALYRALNKVAESTLQYKEITKLDNGDSASKQLADYYRLYCKVLNAVYNRTLTNELFHNAAILENEAKANPQRITEAFRNNTLSFEPLNKLIELYLSAKPESFELNCHFFGAFRYLDHIFWNDELLLTVLKTAIRLDTSCLKYAILNKLSPEAVLKIYERISKEALKYDYRTHSEAKRYLSSSGSQAIIQRLVEIGKDPYWNEAWTH